MENLVKTAVRSTIEGEISMCKFITPNDVGATGGHQSGFHIHKSAWRLFFDTEGVKGENKDHNIKIRWQDGSDTDSRAIYYGTGTRNEYRLTRFGRGFSFLTDAHIGDLLIIVKRGADLYDAFVLSTDDEIGEFFDTFGMSSIDANKIINISGFVSSEPLEETLTQKARVFTEFPTGKVVAELARSAFNEKNGITENDINDNPDRIILNWIETEYELFRILENQLCSDVFKQQFADAESFIQAANSIANRRKSRAGRSLELHLEEVFKTRKIRFEAQVFTEGRKQPDFIFPGSKEYHDLAFPSAKLLLLASKTTCKDRWRQVINEADRISIKHLFTLQQGISSTQLEEMYNHGIELVVPSAYINTFPSEYRSRIHSLDGFIQTVERSQL